MTKGQALRTISLRYAENFAPPCGTIAAHQEVIDRLGYVWYGKLGPAVSQAVAADIMKQDDPVILLVRSAGAERWWAHVTDISRNTPEMGVPPYYQGMAKEFGCWFKVARFEQAPRDVMSHCIVSSSGKPLSIASRHSMSPYFIIDYTEED